jgi:hypothetical protein
MKTVKKGLLIGLGLILVLLLSSYLLPSQWKVERSILINAFPKKIYPYVADLKGGWPQWSAFDHEDPNIQYTYSGAASGVGSQRSWISKKMGNGSQIITQADAQKGVEFELRMADTNYVLKGKLAFEADGAVTRVTWTDWGQSGNHPVYRWMSFFMDSFMGSAFERSLEALKKKAEGL